MPKSANEPKSLSFRNMDNFIIETGQDKYYRAYIYSEELSGTYKTVLDLKNPLDSVVYILHLSLSRCLRKLIPRLCKPPEVIFTLGTYG